MLTIILLRNFSSKPALFFFPNFLTLPNCQVPANQTAKCTFLGGMPKKFMAWILIVWAEIGSRAAPVPPDSQKRGKTRLSLHKSLPKLALASNSTSKAGHLARVAENCHQVGRLSAHVKPRLSDGVDLCGLTGFGFITRLG
jgi:hypothetical protein